MALLRNAPWNWAQLIVDKDGKATPEFLAWLQQQLTIAKVVGEAVPQSRLINTGTGLSGGGDLSADLTLVLDAVIDDLNDVDTTSNPPVAGQALVWDNVAGDWVPGDVATSLAVEEGGVTVSTDVNTLNFIGASVASAGSGQVDITIDGSESGGLLPVVDGQLPPNFIQMPDGNLVYMEIAT